eukprot:503531_1
MAEEKDDFLFKNNYSYPHWIMLKINDEIQFLDDNVREPYKNNITEQELKVLKTRVDTDIAVLVANINTDRDDPIKLGDRRLADIIYSRFPMCFWNRTSEWATTKKEFMKNWRRQTQPMVLENERLMCYVKTHHGKTCNEYSNNLIINNNNNDNLWITMFGANKFFSE